MNARTLDSRDKFEYWLMDMDDALASFVDALPQELRTQLDYSPHSLRTLEEWLLARYAATGSMLAPQEATTVDGAARYVGEVFRKNLGGKWTIDFSGEKNAFYGLPQLTGLSGQGAQVCPLTLVTASADRRTGSFLESVYENNKRRPDVH